MVQAVDNSKVSKGKFDVQLPGVTAQHNCLSRTVPVIHFVTGCTATNEMRSLAVFVKELTLYSTLCVKKRLLLASKGPITKQLLYQ